VGVENRGKEHVVAELTCLQEAPTLVGIEGLHPASDDRRAHAISLAATVHEDPRGDTFVAGLLSLDAKRHAGSLLKRLQRRAQLWVALQRKEDVTFNSVGLDEAPRVFHVERLYPSLSHRAVGVGRLDDHWATGGQHRLRRHNLAVPLGLNLELDLHARVKVACELGVFVRREGEEQVTHESVGTDKAPSFLSAERFDRAGQPARADACLGHDSFPLRLQPPSLCKRGVDRETCAGGP